MLKHCLLALVLAGLAITVMPQAIAQNNSSNDQQSPPDHGRGHHDFDPAKRTEMLTKELNLTSDQQSKVQDILKSEQSQMEKLRSDASVSREDRRPKMMEIHKASDSQIRALLDSDQEKKFDEMQSKHEQWQGHRHDGQGPGGPPPDSEQK